MEIYACEQVEDYLNPKKGLVACEKKEALSVLEGLKISHLLQDDELPVNAF